MGIVTLRSGNITSKCSQPGKTTQKPSPIASKWSIPCQ